MPSRGYETVEAGVGISSPKRAHRHVLSVERSEPFILKVVAYRLVCVIQLLSVSFHRSMIDTIHAVILLYQWFNYPPIIVSFSPDSLHFLAHPSWPT